MSSKIDDFSRAQRTETVSYSYPYRWKDFVGNLSAIFPHLSTPSMSFDRSRCAKRTPAFIATSDAFSPVITPNPLAYDVHVYQTPCSYLLFRLLQLREAENDLQRGSRTMRSIMTASKWVIFRAAIVKTVYSLNTKRNATKYFEVGYVSASPVQGSNHHATLSRASMQPSRPIRTIFSARQVTED